MSDYPYYDNMTRTDKTNGKDRILRALPKVAALLLRADDIDEAMNKALALLGRAVDVSRVYIFSNRENLEGQLLTSRRWEWVKKGVVSQIQNPGLQNLSYEKAGFGRWVKLLSAGKAVFGPVESSLQSERDLLKAQDILSLAVVPIVTADIWWGFIGFDDCSSSREWSKSEIDVLLTAAELIGAALERLHVERQLRYWSEFNRNIVESTSVGVLVLDKNARIQVWNGGMEGQFGVDAAEVLGEDIFRVFPVLAEEELGRILRHCIDEEEGFSENRLTHQTRRKGERILDVKVTPLRDIDEQFNGLVVIISDATAQHEAEQALAESEEMYRALTESALMGVYIYREGRFLFVNERMAKITGYSVEELVEISTGDIVAPDDRERLAKKVELIKSGKDKSSHYTFKIARKEGSEGYMEVHTRRIMYHGKEASIGHCLDISHRLKAQEALRASEERYRSTIQSMGDMIHVLDRDMRIVMYNQPFKQWTAELGLELGEVTGKALFEVFPFLPEKVKQEYDEVWRTGKPLITIETTALAGRSIITETRKIPVTDKEGNVERIVTVVRDITERKRAEEALLASEERYRTLQNNIPVGVFRSTPQGEFLSVNRAFADMFGCESVEEMTGILAMDTYAFPEQRLEFLKRMDEEGTVADFEVQLKRKDGSVFWASLNATTVFDEKDKPSHYDGILEDISERKRAEQALAESEEKYRLISENTSDLITVLTFSLNPTFIYVSPSCKAFGYEPADLIGKSSFDFIHPDDKKKLFPLLKRYVEAKAGKLFTGSDAAPSETIELRARDKAGNWYYLESTVDIVGEDILLISRDITERKRAEQALLNEKSFSESVIASLPGIFYLFDEKGRLRQWNENFERISGYSNEEIGKMNVFDFFAGEGRKIMEERIGEVFARGESTAEADFISKSGKKSPYFFTGLRTQIDDTVYLVGMGVDITERKQAEKALAESEERLRSVVQTANDVIVSVNSRGEIVSWNQAGEVMFGYSADEMLGKSLTAIMPERHRKEHQEAFERAISAGRFKYVGRMLETVGLRKDGEEFPVEFTMANWRTADELFFTIILRDISERKRASEALAESEERYRRLVDHNPAAIAVHCEGKIVYANKAAIELMGGTDLEEIIGKSVLGFVHPDYKEIVLERIRKSQEEGKFAEPIEEKFLRLDGKAIDVEVTSIPTTYQGKPSSQVVFWDITGRKRAEEEVRHHSQELKTLLKIVTEVSASLDEKEVTNLIAERATDLIGADGCTIYRFDSQTKELVPQATTIQENREERLSYRIKLKEGITGKAAFERKPILANNVHLADEAIRVPGVKDVPRCLLVAPLVAQGELWGAMTLVRLSQRGFTEHDLELFGIFANQVADAAVNSTLFSLLGESEEKYRSFVEQAIDGIVIIQDGKMVFANRAAARLVDYDLDDLVGMEFSHIVAPECREELADRYRRRMSGEQVPNVYEMKLLARSGQVIDIELNAGVISYGGRPAELAFARDIRERKHAERAIRESEERYRILIETSPEAITLTDLEGKLVMVNQRAALLHGVENSEDLIGLNSFDIIAPEDRKRAVANAQKALQEGRISNVEYTMLRRDGSRFTVELNVSLIVDDAGKPHGFIGVLRDITDRKHAEEVLRESEERYRRLFEDSPISLWEEDLSEVKAYLDALKRKGVKDFGKYFDSHPEEVAKWSSLERILDVNKSSLELYGAKSKEELIESVDKILGPESHPALKEELVAIAEGRTVFQIESVNQTLSGEKKHVNLRLVVAPGHEKTFSKVLISIADITERKRFEQALQESEEKYRTLFENADDAIFLMKDDRFIDCNSSTLKLYGCARDDIVGQTPYRFSPSSQPDGSSSMESALARIKAALDGNPQRFYWKHIRLDSTPFDAEVSLNRMELGGQILIQAIVRDITARKQFEEALRESEEFNRAVIERSPLGISVRSRTGKLLSANDTWKRIWSIPEEDFFRELNLERSELTFSERDDYLKDWLPQVREVYEKGGYLHVPEAHTINPREGGARWVSHHFYALKDERNRVDRVVILTEDITERKEVEEALRESEEKFRLLSEQSIMGIIIVQDDVFKYINQAAADILEYTTEEMLGWKPQEYAKIVHPDDLEFVMDQIQKKQLGKKEVATNYLWKSLTKSGEVKWLETYSKTTYYQGRTADLLTLVDITERKQAEEALRESEEHYRTLVDTAQEGISLVSPEEKIIFVNPKMVDLLGYSSEELVGRNLLDFIASGDTDFVKQETVRREKGETSRYESTIICRDGTSRRVLVNAAPIFDAKGRFSATLGILTDITDLKKVEDELRLRLVYQTAFAQIMNNAIRVGDFDAFVKSCLEILGNALGVSRTFLATNLEIYNDAELSLSDPSSTDSSLPPEERGLQARVSYEWLAPEISSILDVCYSYSDMPDIRARLGRDELVASRVSALPDPDARVFAEAGALSVLVAPLHLRNGFYGFIAAHSCLQERQWKQGETQVFHTIVRLISTVIDRYFDEEERRLAEEALAESEQRYRTLVETSSDIIFLLDPAGQPLYISSAVEKMGYEPGEILNRPRVFLEAIRTDELRMLRAVFFKTMQSGNPVHDIDCEIYDREDRRHWFAVSWNWIKDDKGRVLAVQGVARDISERKQTEKVLRLRMEYEKVLFEISSLFLSEGVSEASEKEFLEKLGRVTEVSRVYLFSHEVEGDRWFMESRHRWVSEQTPELDNDRIGQIYYDEGFERWIQCLSTGEDISGLVSELPEGERVIFEADGILSILVLPIFVEGRFWGGIGFDEAKRLRDWDVEDIRLMWTASQIFSSALATEAKASELVLSYEDLRERERRISELNLRLVEAEEDERRRIARTLHDEIAQQLTGVALALSVPELNSDPQIKERLSDTKEMVKEAQKFIRDLSYELRPPALDNLGLAAAVRALARSVAEGAGVSFVIEGEEEFPRADPDTETMLYRIIQEAVNNAVKHAEADEITVRFEYSAPTLALSVTDDGKGFDVAKVMAESKGVGLRSIHERVALIGGKIELSSSPNKGTKMRIKVEISLNSDKLEK